MNNSNFLNLNWGDLGKGLVMAVLGGFILPVLAAIQTPGFSFLTTNWDQILVLAINGALAAFASYVLKNAFSTSDGKFLGKIG